MFRNFKFLVITNYSSVAIASGILCTSYLNSYDSFHIQFGLFSMQTVHHVKYFPSLYVNKDSKVIGD